MSRIFVDYLDCVPLDGAKFHGGAEYARRMISIMAKNVDNIVILIPKEYKEFIEPDKILFALDNIQVWSLDSMINFRVDEKEAILFIPLMATHRLNQIAKIKSNNPCLSTFVTIHGTRMIDLKPDKMDRYYENSHNQMVYAVKTRLQYRAANIIYKYIYKKYIPYFDGVLTVSNDSMQKIQKISTPRELTLYYGGSHYYDDNYAQNSNMRGKENIFLFLSGGRPEKNLLRTLLAFQHYKMTDQVDMKMIVTGVNDAILKTLKTFPLIDWKILEKDVIIKDYISDNELISLYTRSKYLLYPSKSEGFGLPLIDACLFGLPCLTSSITATPEVLGSAAVYVDPYSVDSIMNGMKRLTSMDYNALINSVKITQERVKSSIRAADLDFVQYMKSKLLIDRAEC